MHKLIICDDDRQWLDRASGIIKAYYNTGKAGETVDIVCCTGRDECVSVVSEDTRLVFMDIELDQRDDEQVPRDPDGIRAAAEINRIFPHIFIVYLTNYLSYALDVYDTDHIWYVLKEEFEERLPDIFSKLDRLENEKKREIIVNSEDNGVVSVPCADILYIERSGRRTAIKTTAGIYTTKAKIGDVMELLPRDGFARCHNSFIVNMAEIKEIHRTLVRMSDDAEIMISRGFSRSFRIQYMDWAGKRSF